MTEVKEKAHSVDTVSPTGAKAKESPELVRTEEKTQPVGSRQAVSRNSRIERQNEEQAKRDTEVSKLSGEDLAQVTDTRTFDGKVIHDSFKYDEYVRDGNVLYPAPQPRPVGTTPTQVGEALEFFSEADQAQREDATNRGEKRD